MSKQEPMLMESPLTGRVFVVTSYKDNGNGTFTARQKYDVTEQFNALLEKRRGTCEDVSTDNGIFKCSECLCKVEEDGVDFGCINFCPDCGKAVKL